MLQEQVSTAKDTTINRGVKTATSQPAGSVKVQKRQVYRGRILLVCIYVTKATVCNLAKKILNPNNFRYLNNAYYVEN